MAAVGRRNETEPSMLLDHRRDEHRVGDKWIVLRRDDGGGHSNTIQHMTRS